jgi:excisionase family DNA binding protein
VGWHDENVMEKLLLTATEAATAPGIGRSKVYELMRAGTLGSIRIDSCRRIPLEDLTALIARLRNTGADGDTSRDGARGDAFS